MGWFSDAVDSIKDAVSSIGDIFSDPLGAFTDILEGTLNFMTFGTYQFAKDMIGGLFQVDIPYQDRKRMVRAAAGSRSIVYGVVRTGGQLVYIESFGKDRRFINMTIVVAAHKVHRIMAVYANGRHIASEISGVGQMGRVNDGQYNIPGEDPNALVWAADGSQTSWVPPTVLDSSGPINPPNWTPAHKLLGMAYVHVFFRYDVDSFESGLPKIEVLVAGKDDIYDPRTGTSGYSTNQALCVLDAIRWDRMMNVPDSDIDMDSFAYAANVADQLVASGPGTVERRYTVNGTIPIDRPPLEVLLGLSAAGAGIPIYTQGQWTYSPGAYSAPVMTLDESDLIGGLRFQPGPSKKARHNKATGTYIDAAQRFEEVEFSQLLIQAYVDDDLEVLEKSYQMPFTSTGSMARRLAKIDIERNRYGVTVQITAKFKALRLTPGDRVALNNVKNGWNGKVFRVEDIEFAFDAGVALTLREDAPEIYDWQEGDVLELDPPPVVQIPEGIGISPPTGLVVDEELYRTITKASIKARMIVSWDADEDGIARAYDVQYALSPDGEWINAATFWQSNEVQINDLLPAQYLVRVRSINAIGAKSDWVQVSYNLMGKTEPPNPPTGLFIRDGILTWNYSEDVDFAGFIVRLQESDKRTWVDALQIHNGLVTSTRFDVRDFVGGVKTFIVRTIDTSGNLSEPAYLTVGLGDPTVNNVIEETCYADIGWPGSITGGFVNGTDAIESSELTVFWGESDSVFWVGSDTAPFWRANYLHMVYEFAFRPLPEAVPSQMTVNISSNRDDYILEYRIPSSEQFWGTPMQFFWGDGEDIFWQGDGTYYQWPGSITGQNAIYLFRLTMPETSSSVAPEVYNVCVSLDVEDIAEVIEDFTVTGGSARLPIVLNYRKIKVVNMTIQDTGTGARTVEILDKDVVNGPLIETLDISELPTECIIDARIQGY